MIGKESVWRCGSSTQLAFDHSTALIVATAPDLELVLPPWAEGLVAEFVHGSTGGLTILPSGADKIRCFGITLASSIVGKAGAYTRLAAAVSGEWLAAPMTGDWDTT